MKIIAVCFLAAASLAISSHVSAQVRLGVASTTRLSSAVRVSNPGVSNALRSNVATTRATARTTTQTTVNTTKTTAQTTKQVAGKTEVSMTRTGENTVNQTTANTETDVKVQSSADVSAKH